MIVISIIGILVGVFLLFVFISYINACSSRDYNYEFFNWGNYIISSIGFWMIYFGDKWYANALKNNSDILNGQLLVGIEISIIVVVVYFNIKQTTLLFGFAISLLQLMIYAGLAIVGLYALIIAIAFFANTKPVYNLN